MGNDLVKENYVKFESPCPSCKNNSNIHWVHSSDNCHEGINNQGDIRCNDIKCYYHQHPLFIMSWAFNCGQHMEQFGSDYIKPGKTRAINAIHMLANNADLNFTKEEEDFICDKILRWKNDS